MEIVEPSWYLKPRCPCRTCAGEGRLLCLACSNCARLIVVCDEVGTIFPDPNDLTQEAGDVHFATAPFVCPGCGQIPVDNFSGATWQQIQAAGFKPDQYES